VLSKGETECAQAGNSLGGALDEGLREKCPPRRPVRCYTENGSRECSRTRCARAENTVVVVGGTRFFDAKPRFKDLAVLPARISNR